MAHTNPVLAALLVALASIASVDAFAPAGLAGHKGIALRSPNRRTAAPLKLKASATDMMVAQTASLLLAFDPEGSKVDKLYDGVASTGAVNAPGYVLPLVAVGVSALMIVAIPLLLKPGTDAFNEQRNDVGVWSEKQERQ